MPSPDSVQESSLFEYAVSQGLASGPNRCVTAQIDAADEITILKLMRHETSESLLSAFHKTALQQLEKIKIPVKSVADFTSEMFPAQLGQIWFVSPVAKSIGSATDYVCMPAPTLFRGATTRERILASANEFELCPLMNESGPESGEIDRHLGIIIAADEEKLLTRKNQLVRDPCNAHISATEISHVSKSVAKNLVGAKHRGQNEGCATVEFPFLERLIASSDAFAGSTGLERD